MQAIENLGFQKMTPVQAATIPVFTAHKDVCVQVHLLDCMSPALAIMNALCPSNLGYYRLGEDASFLDPHP